MTFIPRMTITHNSLTPKWRLDRDAGDYPSNAGSRPGPPRAVCEDIMGSLHVECSPPCDDEDEWRDFLDMIADDVCPTVAIVEWLKFSEAIVDGKQTVVWVAREWEEQ